LIGLGDSWTQGEGGYPEELWQANKGRMWLKLEESKHLIPIEQENSWVNRLANKIEYTPINLGQRAIGNRGAVRSLYLQDFSQYTTGTIVLLLSGFDRFDFFNNNWATDHYKFTTLWPHMKNKEINTLYGLLYNEESSAIETACCILEAQTFAKANNFNFIFANAFEIRGKTYFDKMCPTVSAKINWQNYVHTFTDYRCFAELLVRKDGIYPEEKIMHGSINEFVNFYTNLPYPAKYMTNDIHPTITGYELISEEIKTIFNL